MMKRFRNYIRHLHIPFWYVVGLSVMLCLFGCKTKYVSVPEYHTVYKTKTDSFLRSDTVVEKEWMTIKEVDSTQLAELGIQLKNITSAYLIERNRNKEHSNSTISVKTDTVLKVDSIPVPYPVERKLNRWERLKMDFGSIAIGVSAAIVLFILIWLVIKNK